MKNTSPKILIDCRYITEKRTGFTTYQIQILKGLYEHSFFKNYNIQLLVNNWYNENRNFYDIGDSNAFEWYSSKSNFLSVNEFLILPSEIKQSNCNAFHTPTFSTPLLPFLTSLNIPYAQTIHDLNHLKFGNLSKKLYYQIILKKFAQKSDFLITVSKTSKMEIQEWIPEKTITVVANSLELPSEFEPPLKLPTSLNSFFINIAPFKSHKNLALLFLAFQEWQTENPQFDYIQFITTALKSDVPHSLWCKNMHSISEFLRPPDIADSLWVNAFLKASRAHFFPSLYEGFGLPPCEAFLAGVPSVVSSIPVHQEVLAEIPEIHWVPPQNKNEWKNAFTLAAEGKLLSPSEKSKNVLLKKWSRSNSTLILDQIYRKMLFK